MKEILLVGLLVALTHEGCSAMKIEKFKRVLEEKQPIEILLLKHSGQMSREQIDFMHGIKNGEVGRSTVIASTKDLQEALDAYTLCAPVPTEDVIYQPSSSYPRNTSQQPNAFSSGRSFCRNMSPRPSIPFLDDLMGISPISFSPGLRDTSQQPNAFSSGRSFCRNMSPRPNAFSSEASFSRNISQQPNAPSSISSFREIKDGCIIELPTAPFMLKVETITGNGDCALKALGLDRNNLANFLGGLVNTSAPQLQEVKDTVRTILLFDCNDTIRKGKKETGDGWEKAAAKKDADAKDNVDRDSININYYIENYIRREPADFKTTFGVYDFYNSPDIGSGGIGAIAAAALGKNIHIVIIPHDEKDRFLEYVEKAIINDIERVPGLDGLFEANQSGGVLEHKLVSSEPERKDVYPIYRHSNHYELGIPVDLEIPEHK